MSRVVGVDGCKAGWFASWRDNETGVIQSKIYSTAQQLLASDFKVIAIDIPIGLSQTGTRSADQLARRKLGAKKSSSVFSAPLRCCLKATTRLEASELSLEVCGKGVSAQSFAIYPKILDVDEALQSSDEGVKAKVFEVHPEVCFNELNGGSSILTRKGDSAGFAERYNLLQSIFDDALFDESYAKIRDGYYRNQAQDDDILDSFVALWSAERIEKRLARSLPGPPEVDCDTGFSMAIWY